ncbi:hypothetical protein Tco_0738775 [Tanacetum coccineum]
MTGFKILHLYDSLVQFEPHVQASKAKRVARNHDPLALIAHLNASSSQSHTSPSYSHSPQPYYVTHPSSVVNYEEDYQGELQGDSQEDKLTTAMMLLARAITQKFSAPTRYGGNGNGNAGRQNKVKHLMQEMGHYARDCQKPRVRGAKYFREQMLLATKDEAKSNLKDKENDFMLDNSYGDETLEELTVANHGKRKTVINTSDDDQIDSNIIFDDPYVENNSGLAETCFQMHDQVS